MCVKEKSSEVVMGRRDKNNYYLDLADVVSERSTCLRRRFGAVIVKDDEVIATGYVGAPRGRKNCCDLGECTRQNSRFPVVNGTNFVVVSMRKRMLSSVPKEVRCLALRCIYQVGKSIRVNIFKTLTVVPCVNA